MFKSKMLFIVGAGASAEAKLPTGEKLKPEIARLLEFKFDYGQRLSGDQCIADALKKLADNDQRRYDAYYNACKTICDVLPMKGSIDDCIDSFPDDSNIATCAKLAIARVILEKEGSSKLYHRPIKTGRFNFGDIDDTWYMRLLRIATHGFTTRDAERTIENLSFVTFNYDRCIEHFFEMGIRASFNLAEAESQDIARRLEVIHPYGVVGHLPWQKMETAVPFGSQDHNRPTHLVAIAEQVRTYSEQITDETKLAALRSAIEWAEVIVFLGFGFHAQNMKLLSIDRKHANQVYGTALNASEANRAAFVKSIANSLHIPSQNIVISKDLPCGAFMDFYSRALSGTY